MKTHLKTIGTLVLIFSILCLYLLINGVNLIFNPEYGIYSSIFLIIELIIFYICIYCCISQGNKL